MPDGEGTGLPAGAPGVSEGAESQEIAGATNAAESMPETSTTGKTIPEADFRKFQSESDKRISQMQKAWDEERLQAMTVIDQLARKVDELSMAGAPPEVIEHKKQERDLAMQRFLLEQEKKNMLPVLREATIQKLCSQYGVPRDELEQFDNAYAMEGFAKAYSKSQRKKELDRRIENKVDEQEGASATSAVDISNIKDPLALLSMGFAQRDKNKTRR